MITARRFLFILLSLAMLVSPSVQAAWIQLEHAQVQATLPKDWRIQKKFLNLPLAYVSPLKKQTRLTLAVVPTRYTHPLLDEKKLRDTQDEYYAGRKKWLKRSGGQFKKSHPHRSVASTNVASIQSIGYEYQLGAHRYLEQTYFVVCAETNKLVHLKGLARLDQFPQAIEQFDKIVESFRCR